MNSNSAPQTATVTIRFSDYWLSSTGGSGQGDLDTICHRDTDGCPALPMTQVKGMLRETAERLWPAAEVDNLFGERDADDRTPLAGALRFAGEARLSAGERAYFAANLAARAALFGRLRSTRINDQGVADDNMLRTAEVAVPLEINGRVDWNSVDGAALDDHWVGELDQLCKLTFAFGHGKMDGLGRAVASAKAGEPDVSETIRADARTLTIDLFPDDQAVFSRLNANEGRQTTHIGPTGAALWGWAIGQLLGDVEALQALLAGQIRFSDAVPLSEGGEPAFTRPNLLYAPKQPEGDADTPFVDGQYVPAALSIGMQAFIERHGENKQAEALGPGPMTLALDAVADVDRGHRLRSAHQDGKAADGKLFGYQHLERVPQGYRARIEASETLDPAIWKQVVGVFARRLFLGKARNNGYGGGYRVAQASGDWPASPVLTKGVTEARIWCLTDLALSDDWGGLKSAPEAQDFGLPAGWKLDRAESAVTTRRFAPWDSALRGHESEIMVIEAGSVFAFGGDPVQEDKVLAARVGSLGERGCGWIALLPGEMPATATGRRSGKASRVVAESKLTKWAALRAEARDTSDADRWARSMIAAMSAGGDFFDAVREGPAKTQWSALTRDTDYATLRDEHGWSAFGGSTGAWQTLKQWLGERLLVLNGGTAGESAKDGAFKRVIDHARRGAPQAKGRDQ